MLKLIKCGKLSRLERENIGRRVRRQDLSRQAIDEAEEGSGEDKEYEEEGILDSGEDCVIVIYEEDNHNDENIFEDTVDLGDHNSVLASDGSPSEDDDEIAFEVNRDCGLHEQIIVQRIDVICEGDETRPIDDVGKTVKYTHPK